jgi:ATP-dependent Clp protease ATP-binding subunit ClpB
MSMSVFFNPLAYFSPSTILSSSVPTFQCLDDLFEAMKQSGNPISLYKKNLETLLTNPSEADLVHINQFIKQVLDHTLSANGDLSATIHFLAEIFEESLLIRLANHNNQGELKLTTAFEWAQFQLPFLPFRKETTFNDHVTCEWKKFRPIVIYFIPQLIDTFIGAFNFLDSRKKYTTLWEKSLLIGIVCNVFVIPYLIVKTLQPIFVSTVKVYAIAGTIIFAFGVLMACYQKWFKPQPDHVVNCINQEEIIQSEIQGVKVGQTKELSLVISSLFQKQNILIIGKSGEGKSSLIHRLIQMKAEGKLPKGLQELIPYKLDCKSIMSNATYGHAEMITQTKEQILGFNNLIILDGIHELAGTQAFSAFIEGFVNDSRVQFIATATDLGYEKILKFDEGEEFQRRIKVIRLDGEDETQIKLTLNELVNQTAEGIEVTDEAIDEVVRLSKDPHYLSKVGCPAKAAKIMAEAIGICKMSFNPYFVSAELCELKQKLDLETASLQRKKENKRFQMFEELTSRYNALEAKRLEDNAQVEKIKTLIDMKLKFKDDYHRLAHQIAKESKEFKISKRDKNLFLLHDQFVQNIFDTVIRQKIDIIKDRRSLIIDKELIIQASKALKVQTEGIVDDKL